MIILGNFYSCVLTNSVLLKIWMFIWPSLHQTSFVKKGIGHSHCLLILLCGNGRQEYTRGGWKIHPVGKFLNPGLETIEWIRIRTDPEFSVQVGSRSRCGLIVPDPDPRFGLFDKWSTLSMITHKFHQKGLKWPKRFDAILLCALKFFYFLSWPSFREGSGSGPGMTSGYGLNAFRNLNTPFRYLVHGFAGTRWYDGRNFI